MKWIQFHLSAPSNGFTEDDCSSTWAVCSAGQWHTQRTQFLLGTRKCECRDEELTPSLLLSPLRFSFWAFTDFKFLFLSIKKPSLCIWSESALEARKFCKGQPEEDTSIIYLPLGEGMNQINYFSWATAGRLTPAIIITIKSRGGR